MSTLSKEAVAAAVAKSNREPQRPQVEPLRTGFTIRTGEDSLTSRGFSLVKAMGMVTGRLTADECKVELDGMRSFTKAVDDTGCRATALSSGTLLMPLGMRFLPQQVTEHSAYRTFRKAWDAGVSGYDQEEVEWMRRRLVKSGGQSSLDDSIGGTLVGPPVQGELIDLVRPQEALIAAGATQVPLPPNGRIVYPAATSPTTAYWVGEKQTITDSEVGTGEVALMAKKLAVLVKVPNELFRFSTVAADALIRTDASKSLALGLDNAALYGTGAVQPKGLVFYNGTNEVIDYAATTNPAPRGLGTDGNSLQPEDGFRMAGQVEDRNFEFKGWIMRPILWGGIASRRASAITAGDEAGQFSQSQFREIGDGATPTWCGYKVTRSAVIRNNQTKGSSGATLTEAWGGQWEHLMLGMYGAIEITTGSTGDTQLATDQTHVRVLMLCDSAPRYRGAFAYYKALLRS
jgi:HK97 family phage major capsid protein